MHIDVLGLLRSAARRFGPVFRLDYGFGCHPTYLYGDEAFTLLRNEHVDSSSLRRLVPIVVQDSLICEDGATHKRVRNAIDAPFTLKGLEAARTGEVIHDIVATRISTWKGRRTVRISDETRKIALAVIFGLIGIDEASWDQWNVKYGDFALGIFNFPFNLPGTPSWRSMRAIEWMNDRLNRLIDRSGLEMSNRSLLGVLTTGEDARLRELSRTELLSNLRLLGLAGHETAASVMTWMLLYLARYPRLWDRLCREALAAEAPPLVPSELSRFPFAEALFREATRLHPPVWFLPRRARRTFKYKGVTVPEDELVGLPLITLSRSTERYPDPDRFDPDRWLGQPHGRHPIETCQFGGGPHFCLGYRLALLEGVLFVVVVARTLASANRRPVLLRPFPRPRYLPVTHAPHDTEVGLDASMSAT